MPDLPPTGAEQKREGELYLSEVIELAQLNGAKFTKTDNAWHLMGEGLAPQVIFHTRSWTSLSDAAAAFCKFHDIRFERDRLLADRSKLTPAQYCQALYDRARDYPSPEDLRRKYETPKENP